MPDKRASSVRRRIDTALIIAASIADPASVCARDTVLTSPMASGAGSTRTSDSSACVAAATLPGDRMLLGGYRTQDGQSDLILVRLLPDSQLDAAFGDAGRAGFDGGRDDMAYGLALQPDGTTLVASSSHNATDTDALVLRFCPDDRLDSAFGGGVARLGSRPGAADHGLAITLRPNDTIVVAGWSQGHNDAGLRLWALTSGGRPLPGFGDDGVVTVDRGFDELAAALKVLPGGGMLVAGRNYSGNDFDMLLIRLAPAGRLDRAFAGDGALYAVDTLSDGRGIVAGQSQWPGVASPLVFVVDRDARAAPRIIAGPACGLFGRVLAWRSREGCDRSPAAASAGFRCRRQSSWQSITGARPPLLPFLAMPTPPQLSPLIHQAGRHSSCTPGGRPDRRERLGR